MQCNKCGAENKDGAAFCTACGADLRGVSPNTNMPKGTHNQLFTFEHNASRIELFIRIVYNFLICIVAAVYGFITGICILIQWLHILILGRRSEGLSNFVKGYLEYIVHVMRYMYVMTDKRPGILPVSTKIYEEVL